MIKIIGAGIKKGDMTAAGKKALKECGIALSRGKMYFKTEVIAPLYSGIADYAELNKKIVERVLLLEKQYGSVAYCAVGDGFTDGAAQILADGYGAEIVPGVSEYRGRGFGSQMVTMSAYDINSATDIDTTLDLYIYQIEGLNAAGDLKIRLLEFYPHDITVVFTSGGKQESIKLEDLDRQRKYCEATVYIKGEKDFLKKKRFCGRDLSNIMERLTDKDGCPWDKAQTHKSIAINMLEEAYEAADAIEKDDIENMIEEFGDVLLQVDFHCDIAKRSGEFTLGDVITALCQKLITRHTHIFGENRASDPESALKFWEAAKAKEKKYSTLEEKLKRLSPNFASALYAQKVAGKAEKAGFAVDAGALRKKAAEILSRGECKEDEYGTALLCAVISAAKDGTDGETALLKKASELAEKCVQKDKDGDKKPIIELL